MTTVGVSITATKVVVAQVDGTDEDWTVPAFAGLPLPTGEDLTPERIARTVVACWRLAGLPTEAQVRCAIEGPSVSYTRRPGDTHGLAIASQGLPTDAQNQLTKVQPGQAIMSAPSEVTAFVKSLFPTHRPAVLETIVPSGLAARSVIAPRETGVRGIVSVDGQEITVAGEKDGLLHTIRTHDGVSLTDAVQDADAGIALAPQQMAALVDDATKALTVAEQLLGRLDEVVVIGIGGSMAEFVRLLGAKMQVPTRVGDDVVDRLGGGALTPSELRRAAPQLAAAVGAGVMGLQGKKATLG